MTNEAFLVITRRIVCKNTMKTYHMFKVTITPKYKQSFGQGNEFSIEVKATNKRDASKTARNRLEADGHIFTRDDACTFKAELIEE